MNADNMDFIRGIQVIERPMTDDEIAFFFGLPVPRSRGEKVVKLTAPAPTEWRIHDGHQTAHLRR